MSKLMIALFVTAGLGFAGAGVAQMNAPMPSSAPMSKASYTQAVKDAKAEAEAAYKHTPKARESARVAQAQANYNVAIEKCDDLAGNRKDVCVKEAKAELVKGKANAKVDRVAADTSHEAATKQAEARKDASADKRDAEYKVAIEKCDALAGSAKDACVSNAKVQFGKS